MTTQSTTAAFTKDGLEVERRFTTAGVHPYDEIEWEIRDAIIGDPAKPAFAQHDVEFPKSWSQNATNIVAQKYFRGVPDTPERESSVRQMIDRVAGTPRPTAGSQRRTPQLTALQAKLQADH